MTLGQRIQELRKAMGLSQEGLGERLGVSRQAISKWEADGAVPEVDKLIALSRLFGVSLNALLQVDCPADTPEEEEQAAEEYTRKARRRHVLKDVGHALTAVLVAVLVGAVAILWFRVDTLEEQNAAAESSLFALRGQLSALQLPQPTPAATDDLFATRSCTVETIDPDEDTVTLLLSVTPKRYINGMTAEFTATGQSFSPVATGCTESAGQTFTTRLTCPLDDEITITVALDVDKSGVKDVRTLDTLYNLKRDSTITVNTWWENSKQVAIEVAVGDRATAQPDQVRLLVKKDAVVVNEYRVNLRDQFEPSANGGATAIGPVTYFIYPEESKGEAQFVAYLKDTTGREYEVPLE